MAVEKLKLAASNLFDSWAANIRAGITPDDIKFLDQAENPYNYMGMSAEEKMRLYDLRDRIKSAKEEIEQEKSKDKTENAEKPKHAGKFIATEAGLIVNTPAGRKYADDLDKRAKAMNWDEIKKLEYLSQGEDNIEFTLKRIKEDADNLASSPEKNDEKLVTLRAAELFLRREEAKKRGQKNEGGEKLEGEKLFQQQIENNSYPNAKGLQVDMIFFIKSVDKGISKPEDFQYLKEELSELLYRCGVEYMNGKETKIDGKDKEIIQPILDLRKEMDSRNTLSQARIDDFRKRLVGYMEDTFGIETQEPREGKNYERKKMQALKVEETKNEFLDYKIKKVYTHGYQINEKLFDYYKKWFAEKEQGMKQKWRKMKDSVSREEFDKITDQDQKWLKQHSFTKLIKPAQVEIYKFKV